MNYEHSAATWHVCVLDSHNSIIRLKKFTRHYVQYMFLIKLKLNQHLISSSYWKYEPIKIKQ